ncbi:MAG: hypothetical protein HY608_03430 [Planctomycetes bacterium]|nr:hypothetical protein [Planctomycetota bacterium]
MSRRTLALELIPLAAVSACFFLTLFYVFPQLYEDRPQVDENPEEVFRQQAQGFMFLPLVGILLYLGLTVGAWIASRVEEPCRDINAILERVAPTRVIATADERERYRRGVIRTLFLLKTMFAVFMLVYQLYKFREFSS